MFISHASENKAEVALPLAKLLTEKGVRVWIDSFELRLGDSLRRSIDRGLAGSRFGIVILSPEFFRKEWPQRELDGLAARELGIGKVILPIWHNITQDEIVKYSPTLADRLAVSTTKGLEYVAQQVLHVIREEPVSPPRPAPPPPATRRPDVQPQSPPAGQTSNDLLQVLIAMTGFWGPFILFLFGYLFLPSELSNKFGVLPMTLPTYVAYGILYLFLGVFAGYIEPQLKWRLGLVPCLVPCIVSLLLTVKFKDEPWYFGQLLGLIISMPMCAIIGLLLGAFFSRGRAT